MHQYPTPPSTGHSGDEWPTHMPEIKGAMLGGWGHLKDKSDHRPRKFEALKFKGLLWLGKQFKSISDGLSG